ncbi:hypothetical protein AALP_AA8G079800 [Arabis alpina]|uniref:Protein-S-isoprenylcysteine O-methyltransferase n=1 Tax=Arabis alpina TaxID=50452 RepID=A0A087G5P4_ARAAL|nr:hypothetical protein AALP_AA8G079800 [Arabis alpina]
MVDQHFRSYNNCFRRNHPQTAIITAGRSFTNLVKIRHEEHHRLLTEGVYRIMRHPSYYGFLIWSVGTQVMLCNPISAIAFAVVVWRFFAERIPLRSSSFKSSDHIALIILRREKRKR